jgi:head-tail adaptor
MKAGAHDTLVRLHRATVAQATNGEEISTWAEVGDGEWARIHWGRGDERRTAAMEQAAQPATFVLWDNALTRSVGVADRIVFDGDWDIVGIATPNRGEIEFSAVRAS